MVPSLARQWFRTLAVVAVSAAAEATMAQPSRVRGVLTANGPVASARGVFVENIRDGAPDVDTLTGELRVRASGLPPYAIFMLESGAMPLGTFVTDRSGRGGLRLHATLLPVDPRGRYLSIVDDVGNDVLGGELDDPAAPGNVRCCLDVVDRPGCHNVVPGECELAGGVDLGPGPCDPDPCRPVAADDP